MFIVHCFVRTKDDKVADFIEVATANSRASLTEPGCTRFDVIQQLDDPTQFVLVEGYRSPEDLEFHKTQPHYFAWKEAMEEIQAEPRYTRKYQNLQPGDEAWGL